MNPCNRRCMAILLACLAVTACGEGAPGSSESDIQQPTVESINAHRKTAAAAAEVKSAEKKQDPETKKSTGFRFYGADVGEVYANGVFILGRDEKTGDLGFACFSNLPSSGSVLPELRAGVGAVMVGARPNTAWKQRGIELLEKGMPPASIADLLVSEEAHPRARLLLILDKDGQQASYMGIGVLGSPRTSYVKSGKQCLTAGILLEPVPALEKMIEVFETRNGLPLAERLLIALDAAWSSDPQGPLNDIAPAWSASLMVTRNEAGYDSRSDKLVDLRIDLDRSPMEKLKQTYATWAQNVLTGRLQAQQRRLSDTRGPVYKQNNAWLYRLRSKLPLGK